ncbi:MAG: stage III sporulation protein AA [Oscillospiraceae bacterium]|jgi:stage III sporulation protein AA|nr:stage III sporulation protein AA [Oscillospiraceae bacterium]
MAILSLGARPFDEAAAHLPPFLQERLAGVPEELRCRTREIRMRAGGPLRLTAAEGTIFFTAAGRPTALLPDPCLRLSAQEVAEVFRCLCGYSVHSYTEDVARGFLTLPGGHRAGICGTAVTERGGVVSVRNISSINLRVAREIPGAAKALCEKIYRNGQLPGLLLAGAPGSGKTTLLRDLAVRLSDGLCGNYVRTVIIDERGELAGSRDGIPCCHIGAGTDVLTGYPKGEGILLALRSLSPEIILCDELGGEEDAAAIAAGLYAGVSFAVSVHAGSLAEAAARPVTRQLLETGGFGWGCALAGPKDPCQIAELRPLHETGTPERMVIV